MNGPKPSQSESRALLATCVAAAAKAAGIIRAHAGQLHAVQWEAKSQTDFVSQVDRDAEGAIAAVVAERHPGALLVAEEGSPDSALSHGLVFVADPLDGTTNFLHGFPWYAVSIAALRDGETVAGVVLNAATGELFSATLGGGARRAGEPIHVSAQQEPARSLIATGFPFRAGHHIAPYLASLPPIMRSTAGLRRAGAAALDLADVACGRFEAFWELELYPWDMAAGALLIREAGGVVTDMDGSPSRVARASLVAGNPHMHAWLLERVRDHQAPSTPIAS
ncbi:MAG: hypothetical protein JWO05_1281 [Gemmatimonadetes bacterium]|nr:hypothetical protein [Gemmatimonadota bacterium]